MECNTPLHISFPWEYEAAATLPEDILKYVSSSKGLEERRGEGDVQTKRQRERERERGREKENEEETKVLLLRGNMYRFGLGRIRLTS